ncbi:MAG: YHS domain-containing protein [Limnochordales bacterium]|nr:YHS domain-containing protein [Limnochordales bacterium]
MLASRRGGIGIDWLLPLLGLAMAVFCLSHVLSGHRHGHEGHGASPVRAASPGSTRAKAVDPVCGMSVDPSSAAGKTEYQGQTYYFCAVACKREFEKNPEKYVAAERRPKTLTPSAPDTPAMASRTEEGMAAPAAIAVTKGMAAVTSQTRGRPQPAAESSRAGPFSNPG